MKKYKITGVLMVILAVIIVMASCGKAGTVEYIVQGKKYEASTINKDKKVEIPTDPKIEGYKFMGWFLDEKFEKPFKPVKLKKSKNIKVYARLDKIMVNMMIDGKSMGDKHILDIKEYQPQEEGLTFDGWYIDENFTTKYENQPTDKVYARHVPKVVYNNGYEVIGEVLVTDKSGKLQKPNLEDNSFVKYYMDKEGIEFFINENKYDFEEPISQNTEIKVNWKTPGLLFSKNSNGAETYYVSRLGGEYDDRMQTEQRFPVLSFPSKAMIEIGGEKHEKIVDAINLGESEILNTTKIIVQEGIKYINGLNGHVTSNVKVEEVVLPNSLQIIENSLNMLSKDLKVEIPNSVEVILASLWCQDPKFIGAGVYNKEINIPASVKNMALVPNNLIFEEGSQFYKENGKIFKNDKDTNDKILIAIEPDYQDILTIPEGTTSIQVGTLSSFRFYKFCSKVKFPSTWNKISFNEDLDNYTGEKGTYLNKNDWLYSKSIEGNTLYQDKLDVLEEKNQSDILIMWKIINNLEKVEFLDFNMKEFPESLKDYKGCISTSPTMFEPMKTIDNYPDKVLFSAEKLQDEIVEIKVFAKAVNNKWSVKIELLSGEKLTKDIIRTKLALEDDYIISNIVDYQNNPYDFDLIFVRNNILIVTVENKNTGFKYIENDNGDLMVTEFDESTAELDTATNLYNIYIPKTIDGKKIVGIKDGAFENLESIQSVYMFADVKTIGNNSFKNCKNLQNVIIASNNLENIGESAFEDSGIISIELPLRNLKDVGVCAFRAPNLTIFKTVDEEADRTHAFNPLKAFGMGEWFVNPALEEGKFYLAPYGAKFTGTGSEKTKGEQLLKFTGIKNEEVQKINSEEKVRVPVYDFELYAVAAKGAGCMDGSITLGLTFRESAYPKQEEVIRYNLKKGSISYINKSHIMKTDLYDGTQQLVEVDRYIQFGVVGRIEKGSFQDIDSEIAKVNPLSQKTPSIFILNRDTMTDDEEETKWITTEDFYNESIVEDGWWNGITKDQPEYDAIVRNIVDHMNTTQSLAFM